MQHRFCTFFCVPQFYGCPILYSAFRIQRFYVSYISYSALRVTWFYGSSITYSTFRNFIVLISHIPQSAFRVFIVPISHIPQSAFRVFMVLNSGILWFLYLIFCVCYVSWSSGVNNGRWSVKTGGEIKITSQTNVKFREITGENFISSIIPVYLPNMFSNILVEQNIFRTFKDHY